MLNWITLTESTEEPATGLLAILTATPLLPLILVFVLMYFMMIRPQRKRQKQEQKMRDDVRVGDQITTIGGICGRVVNVKEEELLIETGSDRNKLLIKKWAMQSNDTVHDAPADDDDDDDDDI